MTTATATIPATTNDRWQDVLSGSARWAVVQGDCLVTMRGMPDACVDAVVTDPPAGIGFMGKAWDRDMGGRTAWVAWLAEIMREALRVLKPGGHAVVWALPHTSHWTATAIEDAGFEVRDCLTHLFGSGFPKSLDVSKTIDAALGAEREVLGFRPKHYDSGNRVGGGSCLFDGSLSDIGDNVPATVPATVWDGWGTALKPASEHWWLCRKPFRGTVAACILANGTGGINVEACRVATGDNLNGGAYVGDGARETIFGLGRAEGREFAPPSGRWPTNLVLTHSVGCERVGTLAAKGAGSHVRHATGAVQSVAKGREKPHVTAGYGDGRTETVPAFVCAQDCPVAELDRQSGERPASGIASGPTLRGVNTSVALGVRNGLHGDPAFYGDSGTASRFYPTFEWQEADFATFRYVAKPSTAEREKGCENLSAPESIGHNLSTNACARCGKRVKANGSGDKCECGDLRETVKTSDRGNHHPTVKPIALMEWLVTLVTPPGGVVLDPFTGSGTTGAASFRKGFRFVGCEREPEYVQIARARIEPKGVLL